MWGLFTVDQEAVGRSGSQWTSEGVEQETNCAEGKSRPVLSTASTPLYSPVIRLIECGTDLLNIFAGGIR